MQAARSQNTQHSTLHRGREVQATLCTVRQRNRERRLLRFTSVEQQMHFSGGDAYILASYLFPINKKRKNMSDSEIFQLQQGGSHSQRCREEYNILLSHAEQREPWKSAEKRGCKISPTPVCSQVETINLDFCTDRYL